VVWASPRQLHKDTLSLIMLTSWWIWKLLNPAVFDNTPSVGDLLLNTIKAEAWEWADAEVQGLHPLLP
jgi:hypothetical protein